MRRVTKNGITLRDLEKDSFFGEIGLLTAFYFLSK